VTNQEKQIQRALGTLPAMSEKTESRFLAVCRIGGDNWGGADIGGSCFWATVIEDIKDILKRNGYVLTIEKVR